MTTDAFLHAVGRMNAVLRHAVGAIPATHAVESSPVAKPWLDEIKGTIGR